MNTEQLYGVLTDTITKLERDENYTVQNQVFLDYIHYNKLAYFMANYYSVNIGVEGFRGYKFYSVQTTDVIVRVI